MITILEGCVQVVWMPIKPAATIYMGSLVSDDMSDIAATEGIIVRPVAQGVANITNKDRPLGVAIGHNLRTPKFSATYLAEYITDEGATGLRTSTTEYVGLEGVWPKGGKQAMVQVALIGPNTVLRAPIRNAAIGTAPTSLTSTTGSDGLGVTTDAAEVAGTAGLSTIYCRAGLNAGQYRITDDASATVHTWDRHMLQTNATAGETYVKVPIRSAGMSYVTFGDGTVASFIDSNVASATNYDIIHVIKLDLSEAGNEHCDFMMDTTMFSAVDYNTT